MRFGLALMAGGLALGAPAPAWAQSPPTAGADRYVIQFIRSDEDYRWLAASPRPNGVPAFKHVPLGDGGAFASFGFETRFRIEAYDEPLFGRFGAADFTSAQTRALAHVDVQASPSVRAFVQLGAYDERGRAPAERPFDEGGLDLAQGFIDVRAADARVRIGRQELPFGRFVSLRDGTNARRTFDGARVTWRGGEIGFDALLARPTRNEPGVFDDSANQNDLAWGLAASRSGVTLTYFGREDEEARYAAGRGREERHTLAVRWAGQRGPWRWDAQAGAQWGELTTADRTLDIAALGFASEVSRGLAMPWRPRLALRLDVAGGDDDPRDGRLGTFDLGYPNLAYLSDAAAIAPRNVADLHPFVTVQPSAEFSLTGGVEALWRMEQGDSVYAPPFLALTPPDGPGGAFVGAQWYARGTYRATRHWEVAASLVRIEPGPALTRVGGAAQTFAFVQTSVRY